MPAPNHRPNDAKRPTARLRKAERKRQLLACAKQLFLQHGYQATTMEKIAQAAGVSEPILYHHFDSKKSLFLEVLQEVREATLNRWRLETASLTDPLAKLHAVVDMYLGTTRDHALEFRVMHRTLLETEDQEVAAFLRSFYLDSEALLSGIISEGQQAGVFRRSLDPRIGAWELIRGALGYTLILPLDIPLFAEPDHLPRAIDCMLQGLLKTDV
jgi:AcrR family transcriptional regulator